MPDDFESLAWGERFDGRIFGVILVRKTVGKNLNWFFDAVVDEFLTKMFGWSEDEVGVIGVIYHESPHFGLGVAIGEVIVAFDFGGVRNIPRVKKIQKERDGGAQTKRNNVVFAFVFAAMHDLDGGDFEFFGEMEAGNGTTGFVVYIIYVEILDFGMMTEKPFFDDAWTARDWSESAEE